MTDFLLELRSEEIPARMQDGARAELARLFAAQMAAAGIAADDVSIWSTPRRLALIARDLPVETAAVSEEFKGPRTSAPPQALDGFLRKTGLTQDQLEDRDGVWFATVEKPGRATADVLAEAIPAIVRAFAWPKSMRWGRASTTTESLRWVRPLQGIVAILGEELVPCEVDGIASGTTTKGHRFHSSGDISIVGAHDYAAKLREAHVIVDQEERRAIIRNRAQALCAERGLAWIADEALVAENAGLTEWPVPLLGNFDPAFLEVPPEVVRLTLATNQKYFVTSSWPFPSAGGRDEKPLPSKGGVGVGAIDRASDSPTPSPSLGREGGSLAPAFICTANIEATDGGAAIVAGNRKVLAARLSDARFFWEQDKKTPLAVHAEKLSRITFHEKLGTVADKVERVAKLARWLVEEGIVTDSPPAKAGAQSVTEQTSVTSSSGPRLSPGNSLADLAQQAAELCKADLVTEMVGEFPELQGVMGGYYARAEGLPDAVADAIRDHYKPVGQGDAVPTAPVTVAVSLADKLDTLFGFFMAGELPTGSKDPFALRRAALSVISLIHQNELRVSLFSAFEVYYRSWVEWWRADDRYVAVVEGWHDSEPDTGEAYSFLVHSPFYNDSVLDHMPEYDEGMWLFEIYGYDDTREFYDHELEGIQIFKFLRFDVFRDTALHFLADRLKVQQREAGVRHDLIDAVFALGGEDDLVRLLARVKALQAFVGTADGVNLLAGYKRAANILKKENVTDARRPGLDPGPLADEHQDESGPGSEAGATFAPEPAEAALIAALDAAEPRAAAAVAEERFGDAMAALATLRAPIDAFFDEVTVNDADPAKRAARLALLARLTAAVNGIADFSKIEG